MARIPFVVVGGFLGAGKTTLLNHWLREAQGQRLAVLVNDFGAIDVDGALLQTGNGHQTLSLANGCVCCTIGDDLGAALTQVLAAEPPFDAIGVETSGVADPWRVAQYGLAEPAVVLEAVVVLVDAAALASHRADPLLTETLDRPLAHADLIVLNHADHCDAPALEAAEAWAQALAPGTPVWQTTHAKLPWSAVSGMQLHVARGNSDARGAGWLVPHGHADQFMAWSVQPEGRFDAAALRHWLAQLPPGVLRLKGLLPIADGRWAELHHAGRRGSVRISPAPSGGRPVVVAIGLQGRLPSQALADGLQRTLAPASLPLR